MTHVRSIGFVVLMLLIPLVLLQVPSPVTAAEPGIDLVLGGDPPGSWDASHLKPGDVKNITVVLRNAGTANGYVNLWVENISESDFNGDGAALGKYVWFNFVNTRINTTIPLPASVYDLPHNATDTRYIRIIPLNAGESVSLMLICEFREAGVPQNDAQGDSISFDIHYELVGIPARGTDDERHYWHFSSPRETHTATDSGVQSEMPLQENAMEDPSGDGLSSVSRDLTNIERPILPALKWIHGLATVIGFILVIYTLDFTVRRDTVPRWITAVAISGGILLVAGVSAMAYVVATTSGRSSGIIHAVAGCLSLLPIALIPATGYLHRMFPSFSKPGIHRMRLVIIGLAMLLLSIVLGLTAT